MKMEEPQLEALEDRAPPIEPSASEQIALVMEDLRAMVKAEMRYHRSRLDYTRHVFRWSFRFGAIAAFAFGGASIALVLGLVLTLSPLIGPFAATLLVTISFVIIGMVFATLARRWMRKVYFPEMPNNVDDIT
ncbi:phage holin family protein [Sphingorhabdus sp.]|uniref:phage holin family protein n=1 Tax=Sphingorhabdus sp. TaxID=1902408 RepID=UPI002FDB182F